jgi:3-oxoacyl-(acyl-carrier-protein) synthase/NAD(P)-dependent dehydrogenase (short-subunit alcohol dehydrogenase family)/acyl carrier protein
LIEEASEVFHKKIGSLRFNKPKAKIMACHTGDFYCSTDNLLCDMASVLKKQITSPVNFVDSVRKLYDEGVRVFIESGPSSVLTNLVKNILHKEDVKVISVNLKGRNSVESFKLAIAALFAHGVDVTMVPSESMLKTNEDEHAETESRQQINENSTASYANNSFYKNEAIVYSGVSAGLPGTFKKAFSDNNFDILFEGTNLIEMLNDDEQKQILELNITRILKTSEVTAFKKITSLNEVIKFAGKFGQMNMVEDYLIDEKVLRQTSLAVCAGIAAGYEALRDAGIPLVREYNKTASGSLLPGRLLLPEEMRGDTGIIFANGLFPIDHVISEVSKYTASKFGSKPKMDIIDFYGAVISKITDYDSKKLLTDWFNAHYSKLSANISENDIYEFNHNFMTILSSQANNKLAQLIGATGPNLYINTACSSTASSVSIAEDMIRAGRAKRVIVIGADISSAEAMLPWVGAGFFSIGALSDSHDLFEAAVPFDNRRNGMIIGSGAVGLVLENETDVEKRGMKGVCRILGTHMFNTAGHNSKIDTNRHCIELNKFLSKMENEHGIKRGDIASKTVYCSHETYSPKNGGCGQMEKRSLEYAFGERFKNIKVINTKGMTGHTMGASIEEALSAKALQYQKIPPVSNYKVEDPDLSGLNLSKGGSYQFEYVLRGVSAFGGNGNYNLLQKLSHGDDRVFDKRAYEAWIKSIVSSGDVKLKNFGRILAAEGVIVDFNSEKAEMFSESIKTDNGNDKADHGISAGSSHYKPSENSSVEDEVLKVYSEITKYPVEMLDIEMELEADLGIDTVKQATIFSMLSERFGLSHEGSIALSNYPTIGHIVRFFESKAQDAHKNHRPKEKIESTLEEKIKGTSKVISTSMESGNEDTILDIISEITMYPKEMLEKDMEFEADLGIDTIKQATIFSRIGETFNIEDRSLLSLSSLKTIGSIIQLVKTPSEGGSRHKENERPREDILERELCLQIPVNVEESIGTKDFNIEKKNVLIIGDNKDTVERVSDYFGKYTDHLDKLIFEYPMNLEHFREEAKNLSHKNIEVIIDSTHLGYNLCFNKLSREEEDKYLFLNGQARFIFYKNLFEEVKEPAIRIIAVVAMDGGFGFANRPFIGTDPFYGALCGFYKGLEKELILSTVKLLDFGSFEGEILKDDALLKIRDEIEACKGPYEIGYIDNKRFIIKLDNLDRAELKNKMPFNGEHFLITGGGNGIAAEIIKALSDKISAKFTILGRTPLPLDIEEISRLDESSLEKKKFEIRNTLIEKGLKATPAHVQKEYEKILKAISVHKVIHELKKKNCPVSYMDCDVMDYGKLESAINSAVSVHGPINVIIHAAGIEKSNTLEKKTVEEFNEVFNVKAKGLCNLYRIIEKEQLKAIVGFSSISGRFGNQSQLDYCSANNFISSFMAMSGNENKIHALSISWSGWKDIGMAWRNEYVKTNSEELGIHLIEPKMGAQEFINVFAGRLNAHEVVISRGLSCLNHSVVSKESPLNTPFIDWVVKKDGEIDKVYKILSVKKDPIIENHRLGKTPLMPAVGFMEICAEFHSLLHGRKKQYCFKNILLSNPLKLHRENSQEIVMKPRKLAIEDTYGASFYNYFEPKNMEGKFIELNSMEICSTQLNYQDLEHLKNVEDSNMEEKVVKELLAEKLNITNNSINLGILFMDENCGKYNKAKLNENAVVYSIMLSHEQITNKKYNLDNLLINPVFMDSLMQACGIHSAEISGRVHLPWKIQEFGVVNVPRGIGSFKVYGKLLSETDDIKTYDVIMYNENDEVNYYAKGVAVRRINS